MVVKTGFFKSKSKSRLLFFCCCCFFDKVLMKLFKNITVLPLYSSLALYKKLVVTNTCTSPHFLGTLQFSSNHPIQFSSVLRPTESSGRHDRWFSSDPLPVFPTGGRCEQFWQEHGCPCILGVVYPAFPLPTAASPSLQGTLKDDFREAAVACDKPEPCVCPSLDCCHKRFLWTHKEADLVPHLVAGLVFQIWDAEKFPQALVFESLDPFFRVSKQGPSLKIVQEDGADRLVQLELAEVCCETDAAALPDSV